MFEILSQKSLLTRSKVGLVLAAVILIASVATVNLITSRIPRPSFFMIVVSIFCAVATVYFKNMALRFASCIAGAQAAVRAALWLAHARSHWQFDAAVGGEMITVLAAIIVGVVCVKWLSSTPHKLPPSQGENPVS